MLLFSMSISLKNVTETKNHRGLGKIITEHRIAHIKYKHKIKT